MTAAIILAGGHSRRMGQDKRRLRLWGAAGPTLLEHIVTLAGAVCPEVIVVLNDPEAWPALPARLVIDAYPGTGPLGGLATGLAALVASQALLLACDLPLLQPALLRALVATPLIEDALVPRRLATEGGSANDLTAEPLLAVYHQSCLPTLTTVLARDERRMGAALSCLAVRYLDPSWWMRFDPDGQSFLNLNRPEDLTRATQLLAAMPPSLASG
jgi:molybdopterin-guanine dinucleotide biosynthesis protein A